MGLKITERTGLSLERLLAFNIAYGGIENALPPPPPQQFGRWSEMEDRKLEAGIVACGHKWVAVSTFVGTRGVKQCKSRFYSSSTRQRYGRSFVCRCRCGSLYFFFGFFFGCGSDFDFVFFLVLVQ